MITYQHLCSVISDSLQPHRLQPTRLLCPLDFPGNSTGVDCHFLLQGLFPTQGSNPGLSPSLQTDTLLSEPPGKSGNSLSLCFGGGIERQEYWSGLPFSSSRDLPDPRIEPWSPALQADALPSEPPGNQFNYRDSIIENCYYVSCLYKYLKYFQM